MVYDINMKTKTQPQPNTKWSQPKVQWRAIGNKKNGTVTGYIEGFWCPFANRYVTIPDVSRYYDAVTAPDEVIDATF